MVLKLLTAEESISIQTLYNEIIKAVVESIEHAKSNNSTDKKQKILTTKTLTLLH